MRLVGMKHAATAGGGYMRKERKEGVGSDMMESLEGYE